MICHVLTQVNYPMQGAGVQQTSSSTPEAVSSVDKFEVSAVTAQPAAMQEENWQLRMRLQKMEELLAAQQLKLEVALQHVTAHQPECS